MKPLFGFLFLFGFIQSFDTNARHKPSSLNNNFQMVVVDILTDFLQQIIIKQTISRELENDIKQFLRRIIEIRNRSYSTPEYWYLRQG